ncbi:MAG: zinc-ribbon domain-containing protein [Lachnospiraceae bacterium]|nr:zinc-ribbon domain-containing protein [Lachnospiraceae bacterium]MCD8125797.1 zinc-ribbon domain-containing protein [Lachnospiraceae bacterium]
MGWEQFGQKISKTGKEVSEKVKETSEVVRLRQKKASEEAQLEEVFAEIGRYYFENHEGEIAEDLIPCFEKVTEIQASIEETKAAIDGIRKTKTCPVCGASMEADSVFCSRCGAKM